LAQSGQKTAPVEDAAVPRSDGFALFNAILAPLRGVSDNPWSDEMGQAISIAPCQPCGDFGGELVAATRAERSLRVIGSTMTN